MMGRLLHYLVRYTGIERRRIKPTVDLAWPRVLTGLTRRSKQTADIVMVGWALGPPGIAGLAFAYAFWQLGNQISLGLAGGVISLVSQNYGGDDTNRAELTVKLAIWISTLIAVPITVCYYFYAADLIRLIGSDPEAVASGAVYLQLISLAIVFEFFNKIASRAFAGVGDTVTPMAIRASGAVVNIVLNTVFIFGFGLGAAGAALGTVITTVLVTIALAWGFFGGRYPRTGSFPLRFRVRRQHWHTGLAKQILVVSTPLIFRKLATAVVVFPFLAVAAVFGTVTVAAFEVARQVRGLMNSLAWGSSTAASTLVGQQLGQGNESEAEGYGWDILKLTALAYVVLTVLVIAFSRPIAAVFVDEAGAVAITTVFIIVGAVSAFGLGLDRTASGALRGGGDTRWPFYGKLFGLYAVALPFAYLGTVFPIGVVGLYLALTAETFVPALVNLYRFRTNRWKAVSRQFRPDN